MNKTEKDDDDVVVVNDQQLTIQYDTMTYKKLSLRTYRSFSDYLKLKFNKNEDAINKTEEQEFDNVIRLGIITATKNLFVNDSILLHKGRNPRKDVWKKLGKIAIEFRDCNTYPNILGKYIRPLICKALGNKDPRVIEDYRNTVLKYSGYNDQIIERCSDSRFGDIDVSFFVLLIPKQYITTSSTSSFFLEDHEID